MTIQDITTIVHEKTGLTLKDSHAAVRAFLDAVTESLHRGQDVRLTGFGTFAKRPTKARVGRNPATGKEIKIAASHRVSFKTGKTLSLAVKTHEKKEKKAKKA